jgi:predicted nucleic acid-binding protein
VLAYPKLAKVLDGAEQLADLVVASDEHLLGLGSFERIPVFTPAQFIAAGVDY